MLRFVFEVLLPSVLMVIGGLLIADEIWLAVNAGFCAGWWFGTGIQRRAYLVRAQLVEEFREHCLNLLTENKRLETEVLRLKAEVDETTNLS